MTDAERDYLDAIASRRNAPPSWREQAQARLYAAAKRLLKLELKGKSNG